MSEFIRSAILRPAAECVIVIFFAFLAWWFYLHFAITASSDALQLWGATYQVIAWFGAIAGLLISRRWGGYKSLVGRAILAFSLGLFFQCFGQITYSSYVYFLRIPIPYPSVGDIGFFGSIPFYAYGAYLLARVSGARVSLRSYHQQMLAVLIPLLMLWSSYAFFLRGYDFDWTQPLKIFLDFGYPLGQAGYVSIAILAYFFSRNTLGGLMRKPILTFIAALVMQYLCDFTFLYQANQGTYYSGNINDVMYATSYLLMTLALLYIGVMYKTIQASYPQTAARALVETSVAIFNQIASRIVSEQALVIGPLAWSEAQKVEGLRILDQQKGEVTISSDDPKNAVDQLVAQYERLFGRASHDVCKQAVAGIISGLSPNEIPASLLA